MLSSQKNRGSVRVAVRHTHRVKMPLGFVVWLIVQWSGPRSMRLLLADRWSLFPEVRRGPPVEVEAIDACEAKGDVNERRATS